MVNLDIQPPGVGILRAAAGSEKIRACIELAGTNKVRL
jgi:hypothetical protein